MKRWTLVVFIGFIFFISIATFVTPDIDYSENENRYLQSFPQFSIDKLLSGEFTSDFESYVQDQIVFRNSFINLKAHVALALKMLENNDVYITDDALVKQFIVNDQSTLENNIAKINAFPYATDVMIVPTAASIEADILNPLSYNTNQEALLAQIDKQLTQNFINVYPSLANGDSNYFKTDHHWNVYGAYAGYQYYMQAKQKSLYNYTFSEVAKDFKGTVYSKSGLFDYPGESFYTINEVADLNLEVTIDGKDYTSVFFEEHLDTKDKYAYFLDGNHSLVSIHNEDINDGSSILLIKDSYAHIFTPFLLKNYENVYLIDLRFYQQPVSDFVVTNNIQDILVLYNLESFCTDTNLNLLR